VLTESVFNSPVYRTYGAMIAADNFEPVGFKLPLGLKDNRLLLAAAVRSYNWVQQKNSSLTQSRSRISHAFLLG